MSEDKNKIFEDSKGNKSSKRIIGTGLIIIGAGLLLFVGVMAIYKQIVDSETALTAGKTLVFSGAGLLGVGVLEFFGKNETK